MSTPQSFGASPSDKEIDAVLAMKRVYDRFENPSEGLAQLAEFGNIKLEYWNGPGAIGLNHKECGRMIWLLENDTPFAKAYSFAHEWHHLRFAPNLCAFRELDRLQIAKWEGKADIFAALFVMPLLTSETVEQVHEIFGEDLRRGAHSRIVFFNQQGW